MSNVFEDRQKGFERKYQFDQEQQFRALARRDKLFGLWIAAKLGHAGPAAETYARAVVESNFERPGDDDMLGKVRTDLSAKNVTVSDKELIAQLHACHEEAAQQVKAGLS
jgi:hypothetical protein